MRTPKSYSNLVNSNKITLEILGEVIYSINKRAKNWRDQKRRYKYYDKYDYYGTALENEEKYYKMKSDILEKLEPIVIHKEIRFNSERKRIYNTDDKYDKIDPSIVIKKGRKKNKKTGEVKKFKVIKNKIDVSVYYLYYEVGKYTFHQPINKTELKKYNHLEICDLYDLITYGKDINELLSTQFCKKVYEKLMDGSLEIID